MRGRSRGASGPCSGLALRYVHCSQPPVYAYNARQVGFGLLASLPDTKEVFPLLGRPHDSLDSSGKEQVAPRAATQRRVADGISTVTPSHIQYTTAPLTTPPPRTSPSPYARPQNSPPPKMSRSPSPSSPPLRLRQLCGRQYQQHMLRYMSRAVLT
jgi:hypothetical protein